MLVASMRFPETGAADGPACALAGAVVPVVPDERLQQLRLSVVHHLLVKPSRDLLVGLDAHSGPFSVEISRRSVP
ncbi:hypothetical protein [Candidatus Frankia alpina]|uniref:hypothetical protein n=1 Tax=Candidatus Frankia alpina TaxID=2699483 RepID=UPI0013867633|nr:hypothetical protein [Candidatus Frankia alpina]